MTNADRGAFVQCFNRLLIAFQVSSDDPVRVDAQLQVYFDALADVPLSAVETGAVYLSRRGVDDTGHWSRFPTTAQWHQAADLARDAHVRNAFPLGRDEAWAEICADCSDTGWKQHECTPTHRCGRPFCARSETYTHSYVSACPCRATNPTYRRHHPAPDAPTSAEAGQLTDRVRRGFSRIGE